MANNAIRFFDENEKREMIYTLGEKKNNEIVISSENREYVRGDKLYIEYKGAKIYADLDQVIYINTSTDVVMIKENKKLTAPEERQYLVLLHYEEDDSNNTFQGIVGRQETFDFLKACIDEIDITNSLVLAETVAFKDAISVYEFMHRCIIDEMVTNDDGFDIEEYNITTFGDEEE